MVRTGVTGYVMGSFVLSSGSDRAVVAQQRRVGLSGIAGATALAVVLAALALTVSGSRAAPAAADPVNFTFSGTLVEPGTADSDPAVPVANVSFGVHYFEASTQSWGMYFRGFSFVSGGTDLDGAFDFTIDTADLRPGRTWALHVVPTPDRFDSAVPLGSALLPLTIPDEPGEIALGQVVLPEPNVRGTLLDRPESSDDPISDLSIRLYRALDNGGSRTPQEVRTSSTGAFAFAVDPDLVGEAFAQVDGGHSTSRDRVRFTLPIGQLSAEERLSIDARYPEPNVTGRLTRVAVEADVAAEPEEGIALGDPMGIANVHVRVERLSDVSDDAYWEWLDASGRTDAEGRFFLVATIEPGRTYRLVVDAVSGAASDFPAFTVPLDTATPGGLLDLALSYPSGNLTGVLLDPGGEPVASANVQLSRRIVDGPSEWSQWIGSGATDTDGRFALVIEDADLDAYVNGATYELYVSPPFARSGQLPTFVFTITAGEGAEGRAPADLLDLSVTFPTPNLSGTIREGGEPVSASVSVQREVTQFGSTWWNWIDVSASAGDDGHFALFLPDATEGTYRLRVERYPVNAPASRFTVTLDFSTDESRAAMLDLDVDVPQPNVTGTVLADLGEGPVPIHNAQVEVRRYVASQDYWDSIDVYGYTLADGTFGLILDEAQRTGRLELRVRPPEALSGLVAAFAFALEEGASTLGLTLTAPAPNLSGVVRDPNGMPVVGAWFNVEQEVIENGVAQWYWVEAYGMTGAEGRLAVQVLDVDPTARYRVRVSPPWWGRSQLVEFTAVLPGTGVSTDLELSFPTPNVSGVLRAPDGTTVSRAWISLQTWNEADGYWEWNAGTETSSSGTFSLFADGDGPHRLFVQSPWDRSDLVPFQAALDVSSSLGLDLRFPVPNLQTRLVDGEGAAVRYAGIVVERRTADGGFEWLDLWQSSDGQGRVALLVPEPGEYRLQIQPPWGRQLPTFDAPFTVAADGTLSGIPAELAFPTPNVVLDVVDSGGAAVQYAFVEVRRRVTVNGSAEPEYRSEGAGGATGRSGQVALLLEPGTYRVYVHPPWYATDLAFSVVDLEVVDGGAQVVRTVTLQAPNVIGTVDVDGDRRAAWSWVEVETIAPAAGEQLPGTYVRPDGAFSLGLPTGTHLLRVWSSDPRASSGPLEVVVTIAGDGSVASWRYALQASSVDNCPDGVDPCRLSVSFDDVAVRPNLTGTIVRDGAPVSGGFVTASAIGPGTDGTPEDWTRTAVTDASGAFRLLVPADITVTLRLVITDGDVPVSIALPGTFSAGDVDLALVAAGVSGDTQVAP